MFHSKEELNRLYDEGYVKLVMDNDLEAGIPLAHAIKDLFPDVKRVADVGCNNGVHMKYMLELGFDIEGFDISTAALAKAIVPPELIHIADLRYTIGEYKRFDLAYAVECIEHIELEGLAQFSDNIKALAPILICTPGFQGGTGHFIEQPSTWWIWRFCKAGWQYDIGMTGDLHNYLMQPRWDKDFKKFPFPRRGIMVFRNNVETKRNILEPE